MNKHTYRVARRRAIKAMLQAADAIQWARDHNAEPEYLEAAEAYYLKRATTALLIVARGRKTHHLWC